MRQQREQGRDVDVGGVVRGERRERPRGRCSRPSRRERQPSSAEHQARGAARASAKREAAGSGRRRRASHAGSDDGREREGEPRPRRARAHGAARGGPQRLGRGGREQTAPSGRASCAPRRRATREVRDPSRGAPHLAARGLRHGARRDEHDVVRRHVRPPRPLCCRHRRREPLARRARRRRASRPRPRAPRCRGVAFGHAERHDAAAADALDRGRGLLDLLRHEVAAALDDEVLAPAADVELAVRAVGEVAAVEPAARRA